MKKGILIIFLLVALALFFLGTGTGSIHLSFRESLDALMGRGDENLVVVVRSVRVPRVLAAFILGGGLALSGYLMQTFFHNPIAGPYVLGVASGAKLLVAVTMIVCSLQAFRINSLLLIIVSFIGSLLSMGFVLALSSKVRGMPGLIVAGVMIGYICSAVTDILVTFADDQDIVSLHGWSRGSFSGMSLDRVAFFSPVILLGFFLTFLLAKPISAYMLGENYAYSVGVKVGTLRTQLILLSCLLAGVVTAFAGPVSFVGIAVPQIAGKLMRDERPIFRIPACFLGGGIFCMVCDMIARTVFAPSELSISTVTAVFGAPVVLAILIGRRKKPGDL